VRADHIKCFTQFTIRINTRFSLRRLESEQKCILSVESAAEIGNFDISCWATTWVYACSIWKGGSCRFTLSVFKPVISAANFSTNAGLCCQISSPFNLFFLIVPDNSVGNSSFSVVEGPPGLIFSLITVPF
jgi:hypothetical protein